MKNIDIFNKFRPRFNGVRSCHRNRWALIYYDVLPREEFLLLELCIDVATWDEKKKDYGCFNLNNKQLASFLGYKSHSSVSRLKEKLIDKGLIIKEEEGFCITAMGRYLTTGKGIGYALTAATEEMNISVNHIVSLMGTKCVPVHIDCDSVDEDCDSMHDLDINLGSNSVSKALVSSKVKFNTSSKKVVVRQGIRSDEEYREILNSGNYERLTIDDMKWIDEYEYKNN